jgi:lipopolysaccharide transport system permease protein
VQIQVIETGVIAKDYWINLWKRRELIYFLTRRDLTVRYKQTFVGISWVVIRPFLTMVVFTTIFGSLANLDAKGLPYAFVVFAGVLPWYLFSQTLNDCSNCLGANIALLNKVYFPRLIFPITIFTVAIIDFLVSFVIIIGMMFWYHITPSWQIIFFPFFIFLAATFGLGLGLISATLNVKFRDFQQIIPFILQLGIYISPVGYINELVPKKWEIFYSLNPMAGIINGFRWSLVPESLTPFWPGIAFAAFSSFALLAIGIKLFRQGEARFADTI